MRIRVVDVMVGFLVPVILLCLWQLAAKTHFLPPSLSAAPTDIATQLLTLLNTGILTSHLFYSLLRITVAVTLGTIAGITSGMILGQLKLADRLFTPFIGLLAPVPVVAWLPFAIMAFGSGELFKISLAFLATFLIIHIHTYQAIRAVERYYWELAEMYEKTVIEKIRHILLPAAVPSIFTGLRLTLAIAWIVIFFVEFGSAESGTEGLGWFINDARQMGRVEDEYAGVLLLAVTGFGLDLLVVKWKQRKLVWLDSIESSSGFGGVYD